MATLKDKTEKRFVLLQWFENQEGIPSQFYCRLGSFNLLSQAQDMKNRLSTQHGWDISSIKIVENVE